MHKFLLLATLITCVVFPMPSISETPQENFAENSQFVVVTVSDWQAPMGQLQRFERKDGKWQAIATPFAVSIGKNGSAWGLGLHQNPTDGPLKVEGDGKAPAGIFSINTAFGYPDTVNTSLNYQKMNDTDWCVDVNESPLYNQIVSTREVGINAIEGSTEPMRRDLHLNGDQLYKKGFVISHNPENIPKAGSCIFAHLWRSPGKATAGCTAMSAADMDELLQWLDKDKKPLFVLLPRSEYQRFQQAWQLPTL
jgi:L,D-peptidoglycan transpeptidase YkuD (ErfK/YbiS/YcfS/YnhG family)